MGPDEEETQDQQIDDQQQATPTPASAENDDEDQMLEDDQEQDGEDNQSVDEDDEAELARQQAEAEANDIYGPDGKILKKFKDVKALANAYRELEKHSSKTGNKIGDLRKLLEEQGYTFDAEGNPIAPAAPQGQAAQQQGTAAVQAEPPDDETVDYVDGVKFETYEDDKGNKVKGWLLPMDFGQGEVFIPVDPRTGAPLITDDEWKAEFDRNPFEAQKQYEAWKKTQDTGLQTYEQKREQRTAKVISAERDALVQGLEGLPDDVGKQVLADYLPKMDEYIKRVPVKDRGKKGIATMSAIAAIAEDLPKIIGAAYNKGLEAGKAGRKVIARSGSSSSVAGSKTSANASATKGAEKLTAEQRKMADDLGISHEKYAANL